MCHWVSSLEALAEFRLRRPPLTGALQRARRSGRRSADELHVEPYCGVWSRSTNLARSEVSATRTRCHRAANDAVPHHSARDWTGDGTDTSAEFGSSLGNQQ